MLLLIRLDSRCSATARIVSAADEEEEGGPELDLGENGDAAAAVLSHFVSSSPLPPLFSSALFSSGRKPRSTFCAAEAGMATPAPRAAPSSDDRRRAEAGEPAGRAPRPKTAPVTAAASAESATSAGSPRATPEPSWRAQNRAAREPKRPAPLVFDFLSSFQFSVFEVREGGKARKKLLSSSFPSEERKKNLRLTGSLRSLSARACASSPRRWPERRRRRQLCWRREEDELLLLPSPSSPLPPRPLLLPPPPSTRKRRRRPRRRGPCSPPTPRAAAASAEWGPPGKRGPWRPARRPRDGRKGSRESKKEKRRSVAAAAVSALMAVLLLLLRPDCCCCCCCCCRRRRWYPRCSSSRATSTARRIDPEGNWR